MFELIFIISLAVLFIAIYSIAFRILPGEKWQVFASIPVSKIENGQWHGVNITYYGILTATGYTIAFIIFFIMMSAAGTTPLFLLALAAALIVFFSPSAKLVAFIIERKKHTITVGGGVFVMFISAPFIISAFHRIPLINHNNAIPDIVFLSSLITAYAFGEGFGRLACISFGCCYGKPVDALPFFMRKPFLYFNFVFTGKTKKISYHDHMDGVKTVPVQALTAVLYTSSGLAGLYLFLKGNYYLSFFLSLVITQLWRFVSEFLRADYRGVGKISAYQFMSIIIIPYFSCYVYFTGFSNYRMPDLLTGLQALWNPGMLILLSAMWIGCILYTGISSVTASRIELYVNEDKI